MKDNKFIAITEPDGKKHILNKSYIISVEVNSKGYLAITTGFEDNPPFIRIYAVEGTIEGFERLLKADQ